AGRTGALASWAAAAPVNFPGFLAPMLASFAAITLALAALAYEGVVESAWAVLWAFVTTTIAAIWRQQVHHVLDSIETPDRDLGLLSELLARVERQAFAAPRLAALASGLVSEGQGASRLIAKLRAFVSWDD